MFQSLKQKKHGPVKYKPGCDIYMNKTTGDFVLQNYAITKEFGWNESYGSLVRISNSEIQEHGIDLILSNLKDYHIREKTEGSEFERMLPNQQRKFEKEHKRVGVTLESAICLELWPICRKKCGCIGRPESKVTIILPSTAEEFYKKLLEAFDKC